MPVLTITVRINTGEIEFGLFDVCFAKCPRCDYSSVVTNNEVLIAFDVGLFQIGKYVEAFEDGMSFKNVERKTADMVSRKTKLEARRRAVTK